MFVNVMAEKRQQIDKYHLSLLLSVLQLNKIQRLSIAQEKTCFNSSIVGLGYLFATPIERRAQHNRSLDQVYFFLISILSRDFFINFNWRVGIFSHT
jgi:hypothetical protein